MNPRASVACFNLALAIALGAFGAHALQARLAAEMMTIFHTGSEYHLIVGALLLALSWQKAVPKWFLICGFAGTLFFSGSLYALAITGTRIWGAVTPLGGVTWIVSLLVLAFKLAPIGGRNRNMEQLNGENRSGD